jgi:GT2 family glycosyltransferase/glycosyltransferase involved in cell wall biosynthesis
MHPPSKQIAIAGYFGFGSAGDEAILASLCDALRDAAPPFRLVAISGNSRETAAAYDVQACDWSDAAALSETVRLSDAVVIAGSSLFDPSAAPVVTAGPTTTQPAFLPPAVLSAIHRKPLALYGIGLDGPDLEDMHPALRAVCRAAALIQPLRGDQAKANAALLLDALEQQIPWDAARCVELLALGLGLGPGPAGTDAKTPPAGPLALENEKLRQKNRELAAELELRVREACEATECGRQFQARVAELESSLAVLAESNGALSSGSEHLQQVVEEAERLRHCTVVALDTYQARFDAELRLFRRQRAWKAMLYLRKAYTVLVRGIQAGKFPSLRALMSLIFAPSKNLDWYELRFPLVKHAMPVGLRYPIGQFATTPAIPAPAQPPRRLHGDVPSQRNYDVLILPVFEFDFRFQRPQQLAIQFARAGHRVFWISPSRTASPDEPYEAVPVQPRLHEIRLSAALPNIYLGELKPEHVKAALGCLKALYRDFGIAESCSLALLPFWRRLGVALREAFDTKLLYDCMDDWQTMPDLSAFNRGEESRLAVEADVLVVTGRGLWERHQAAGRKPVLVRNGTDFERFSCAQKRGYLEGIPRPIIGYFGAIANWFDYNLLFEVAQSRPDYSFVLIGGFGLEEKLTHPEAVRLVELPNVHLLGHKPYPEIPAYLAEFDVCIIPFVLNEVTKATDPVKLYEYLSQGKPVVATPMRELQEHRELIYIAAKPAEFASALDAALGERDSGLRQRRIDFAAGQQWSGRWQILDQAIRAAFPLVSILIVTHESAEYVPLCLEALLRNTSYPSFEVIVVDNASRDRTAELVEEFARRDPRLRLIRNQRNQGFAVANNLAAEAARGEYLVLLNIDAVPTPGWVERLMRHSARHPKIGMVVPVTNNIGNEAKIRVTYSNLTEMERFAGAVAADQLGQSFDLTVGPLFCAFVPRAVWNQVGPLDERFKVGMFEDDDFSLRIRNAGFRIVTAEDCFVHHFGGGSFSKLAPADYQEVFATNKRLFEEKWRTTWAPHQYRPGITAEEGRFRLSEFAAV